MATVVVIAICLVVAIRGLLANPVKGTDVNGVTTLSGSFAPYQCSVNSCDGYVQAGGRSVFVVLPKGCTPPAAQSDITVQARRAPNLGSGSYTAIRCARPGG
ncbi:MAG TPA: hypothetical protein VE219_06785 [Candidatus Sulfotelmatobacter sp.]|nr:hypothetical protein [Candidatus Sulfotelmatobacter sp.]